MKVLARSLALSLVALSFAPPPARAAPCSGAVVEVDGTRRLALLVGVGKFRNSGIRQLAGPGNDVAAIAELLVRRYGFPRENVCVLRDDQATTEAFKTAFRRALVERARDHRDVAVFYFSGHGSLMPDQNGDEPSGMDQSLLFHDARWGSVTDLRDDEVNALLAELYEKTRSVTVVFDSCHSGSASRGPEAATGIARMEPPAGQAVPPTGLLPGNGQAWVPTSMPELVVLSAAADGTSALEIAGHGVFTDALVRALNDPSPPLTYAELGRRVPGLVAARSVQVPYFQGRLDRKIFGSDPRPRPLAWDVKSVSTGGVELSGVPLPGIGVNAEFRLYGPTENAADYGDPDKAKALVVVGKPDGGAKANQALTAKGKVTWLASGEQIQPGDLAMLVRPGDDAVRISARLRPPEERGGIPSARAKRLADAIGADHDAANAVVLTQGAADVELAEGKGGRIRVLGTGNELRAELEDEKGVVALLWQLARQKALASLAGDGAPLFRDDQTLRIEIVAAGPDRQTNDCGRRTRGAFVPRPAGSPVQRVPMCVAYSVKVTLAPDAPRPVLVGGVMLSGDGSIVGFPLDGTTPKLDPGRSLVFNELFEARPPLDSPDTLKVFGTLEKNPVMWSVLTSPFTAKGPPASGLHAALDRYLVAGARAAPVVGVNRGTDTQWTVSTLTLRVDANPSFEPSASQSSDPAPREYTISGFDVRPYLPDDPKAALRRVLEVADRLARMQVPYAQHAWAAATFDENVRRGIDCSRAVMAAFTQAGLPYNKAGAYVTTAQMVQGGSPMADEFDRCDGAPRQLGDLLVYRDDERGDGHVVMVIDPLRRIAWGSHGWDGNAKALKVEPQTGVEYQQIKTRDDWGRWDRKKMLEKACWRYRRFADEAREGRGLPGVEALGANPCALDRCTQPPSGALGPPALGAPTRRTNPL